MTFGIIMNQLEGSYFSAQWRVLNHWADTHNIQLMFITGKALNSPIPQEQLHNFTYSLVDTHHLDGLLVYSGSLGNFVSAQELEHLVLQWSGIPCVTINSQVSNLPTIAMDSSAAVSQLVKHIVKDHGCQSIGIVTGDMHNPEAVDRFTLYLHNLQYYGIAKANISVFHGDFSAGSGTRAADHFYTAGLPEAILCSNDEMAHSLILRFQSLGIKIPEDIAVTGFDGLEFGQNFFPAITTVEQPHAETAIRSAELLLDMVRGIEPAAVPAAKCRFAQRQSCGCISPVPLHTVPAQTTPANINDVIRASILQGQALPELHADFLHLVAALASTTDDDRKQQLAEQLKQHYFLAFKASEQIQHTNTYKFFLYQWKFRAVSRCITAAYNLQDLLQTLSEVLPSIDISYCRLFLFSAPIEVVSSLPIPPNTIHLHFEYADGVFHCYPKDAMQLPLDHIFSPWSQENIHGKRRHSTVTKTLFFGNTILGVLQLSADHEFDMLFESLREVICIALQHIKINDTLRHISIRDDLTGLLNRRGFFQLSHEYLANNRQEQQLYLVYIDLDGFKQINDHYGHEQGDTALKEFANVLKRSFRTEDIIGRIGGDEFTILAKSVDVNYPDKIKNRLQDNLQIRNDNTNTVFKLAASLGCYSFLNTPGTSLDQLLAKADKILYAEKRKNATPNRR